MTTRTTILPFLLVAILVCTASTYSGDKQKPPTPPEAALKVFQARSIGPAIMGGRVSAIALDPQDFATFYVGLGTGGLMKTTTSGFTFEPMFEKEAVASVGAVAVAPSHPRQLWVGTGEANDRNSSSWGSGVYVSKDGGANWNHMGLKESRTVARICVDPRDTNTVWVAAMGDLWSFGGDRGLYKTTDGGKSWILSLAAPGKYRDRVGCGDVALDPSRPGTLYATLYARHRTPWSFAQGPDVTDDNDLGGIFKSTDAGGSWTKLKEGLPGRTARIGLAVAASNPRILYAIIQSDEGGTSNIDEVYSKSGGVFRSEDSGGHWVRMNRLNPRPFYFSQIRVDPSNEKKIYVLGYALHISEDGGLSFREEFFDKVHPDLHELVIDPRNTKRLLLGTDGGIYQSFASGKAWIHLNTMAAGEYYRIATDMRTPYWIAGGLQDNTNWAGPSRTMTKDGIQNSDWINIGGGDGFYCVFDPLDSNLVYAESQQGSLHRYNFATGEFKSLQPQPAEGQAAFRFHWNSPLIPSYHAPGTLYLAGNRVFKLTERGEKWQLISPDLTARDPDRIMTTGSGAENYGTIYTLAESPKTPGLLWAGTDDGKLWITEDGGAHWTDLTARLPKQLAGQWITRIEPGHQDAALAYLVVDGHRSGVFAPLAFRTTDKGRSWKSVAGNLPAEAPVKVLREGLRNTNLLFAGTEFNLFMSLDAGATWVKFGGLPTVAVDDILIHPREMDLVIATHGRSLYIIDDIRPLEEFSTDTAAAKAALLFPPRPAAGRYLTPGWADMSGVGVFRGTNPPEGAIINFYVRDFTGESVKISITDSSGRTTASLSAPGVPGFGRVVWDLMPGKDLLTDYGGEGRKFVRSGEYTVTMSYGKLSLKEKVKVEIAPGIETR